MSMKIQAALFSCCEAKSFASSAASRVGKTVTTIGAFVSGSISKIVEFVKPHFEHLKTFVQEHKKLTFIATGVIVGSLVIKGIDIYNKYNVGGPANPKTDPKANAKTANTST